MNERLVFIINPISGLKNKEILEHQIRLSCEKHQKKFDIFYTKYAKHLPLLVKELIYKGYKKIIVAGGDGTINEAGSALIHTDIALGIIPLGSGNGLARHLKIPLDSQKALDKILKSHDTVIIDAGKVNEYYFFSNSGIGFDADVIKRFEKIQNRGLRAYVKCTLESFIYIKSFGFSLDKNKKPTKTFLINVANGSQYGYGYTIAPVASLQDGQLDLTAGNMKNKLHLLQFGAELLLKVKESTHVCFRYKIQDTTISLTDKIPLQVDGELKGIVDKAHFQVISKALKIII
ncbi:MAG: diacylglycerol/lipid kinase family protein [Flavobacteriales bacterium]